MLKLNRKYLATFVALTVGAWGCAPDDYPTTPRFDPPPQEDVLPQGELFFYVPADGGPAITSINLAGEMNGWNNTATPMEQLSDGRWVAGVELEPGTYQYKYVFNGDQWAGHMCADDTWGNPPGGAVDADADDCIEDGFGGANAVRTVGTPQPSGHTFLYIVPEGVDVEVVTVAGSFQDPVWTNDTDTMSNIWTLTVDLEAGTHQYKYVFNDGGWAGNMCDEPDWGHPDFGNAVDPDNDNCVAGGQDAEITIDAAGPHTFRYIVPAGVDSIATIHVAGSFQGWNNASPDHEMQETFQRTYELAPGTYQYKFIFDGNWAGNMCAEDTYANGGMADANGEGCVEGGQDAEITIE